MFFQVGASLVLDISIKKIALEKDGSEFKIFVYYHDDDKEVCFNSTDQNKTIEVYKNIVGKIKDTYGIILTDGSQSCINKEALYDL